MDASILEPPQPMADADALARAFLDALVTNDFPRLRTLLARGAGMRALTPRKVIEEAGADAIAARFALWYAGTKRLVVKEARTGRVSGRSIVQCHLRTWSDEGVRDIFQHAFLDARDGRIHRVDLACSGFLAVDGGA